MYYWGYIRSWKDRQIIQPVRGKAGGHYGNHWPIAVYWRIHVSSALVITNQGHGLSSVRYQVIDSFSTLRPRQNASHFADDVFKRIFLNENCFILILISLKLIPRGPINKKQIMPWRLAIIWTNYSTGYRSIYATFGLSELIQCWFVKLPKETNFNEIWIKMQSFSFKRKYSKISSTLLNKLVDTIDLLNSLRPSDTYIRQWTKHHWFR